MPVALRFNPFLRRAAPSEHPDAFRRVAPPADAGRRRPGRVPSPARDPFRGGTTMADKSPKKSSNKTAAAKTLKEKRTEKKDKSAAKRRSE
jgi:hypothetical protein